MGQPTPPADPGATPPAPPTTTEPAKTEPPATGDGLGEAGKKALAALRDENKELARQIKDLQGRDPLKAIAEALGVKPPTEPDAVARLAEEVKELRAGRAADSLKAMRLEVAAEKGLTPAQAARLQGATRDELVADADALRELFPSAPGTGTTTPGTPAPDPSQGARGSTADLHAAAAAALAKGDVMENIRLQGHLLDAARAKQQ